MRKRLENGKFGRLLLLGLAAAILLAVSGLPTAACTIWTSGFDGTNIAGSNISGTNLWVRAYVTKAKKFNSDYSTYMVLDGSTLASGSQHVKVDTVSPAGQPKIRTNATGYWMSDANKGWVKFDTTHALNDGSNGELRIQMYWTDGTTSNTIYSTLIGNYALYNKAYVLYDPALSYGYDCASAATTACIDMRHSTRLSNTDDWQAISDRIPTYTVFYFYGHGGYDSNTQETYFKDCPDTADIGSNLVSTEVGLKSSSQPQYNFVFIDACESATHSDLADAFGVTTADDRAFLGWDGETHDWFANKNWTLDIWSRLYAGDTIAEAFTYANDHNYEWGTAKYDGDDDTTLHEVYHR
jgi:hypothetical protein